MFKPFILALFLLRISLYGWAAPTEPAIAVLMPESGSQSSAIQIGILAQYYAEFAKNPARTLHFYDTLSDSAAHLYSRAVHEHATAVLIEGNLDSAPEPTTDAVPTLMIRGTLPENSPASFWALDDDPHPKADRILRKAEDLGFRRMVIISSATGPDSLIASLVQSSARIMNPSIQTTAIQLHHGRLGDQLHAALYSSVPEQVRVVVSSGRRHHRHHHYKTITIVRSQPRSLDGIMVLVSPHELPALAWALHKERPDLKVLAMADTWPQGTIPNQWQLTGPLQGAPLHPDLVLDSVAPDITHDAASIRLGADAFNLLSLLMQGSIQDQDLRGHSGLLHPVGTHWWIEPYPGDKP